MQVKVGAGPHGLKVRMLKNKNEDLRGRAECDAVNSYISQHILGNSFVLKNKTKNHKKYTTSNFKKKHTMTLSISVLEGLKAQRG